jgi:hypothetical protein
VTPIIHRRSPTPDVSSEQLVGTWGSLQPIHGLHGRCVTVSVRPGHKDNDICDADRNKTHGGWVHFEVYVRRSCPAGTLRDPWVGKFRGSDV